MGVIMTAVGRAPSGAGPLALLGRLTGRDLFIARTLPDHGILTTAHDELSSRRSSRPASPRTRLHQYARTWAAGRTIRRSRSVTLLAGRLADGPAAALPDGDGM
jgi:hypothetical protein